MRLAHTFFGPAQGQRPLSHRRWRLPRVGEAAVRQQTRLLYPVADRRLHPLRRPVSILRQLPPRPARRVLLPS